MAAALATAALIGLVLPLLLTLLTSLGGGDDELESVTLPLDISTGFKKKKNRLQPECCQVTSSTLPLLNKT